MDVHDIFKKLTSGAKFNFKKIRNDSQKQQINTPQPNLGITKPAQNEVRKTAPSETIIKRGQDDLSNELVLLDSITSKDGKKTKKKVKPKNTEQKIAALEQERVNHFRNVERIAVVGRKVPAPIDSFEQLGTEHKLSPKLIENLKGSGYSEPTRIQMQAIPIMLQGRQILACAPTGSGKTAAFLVPIIHELGGPRREGFRAVIVSPTRELATQTHRECERLSEGIGLRCHIISKGSTAVTKFGPESSHKFDILITTPNRLVYLLKQEPPALDLHNVRWLVVDESDKLFEAGARGFRDQLAVIYQACDSTSIRRAMFSATHTQDVARWARKNLRGLISVTVGLRNTAADIVEQELKFVGSESGKLLAFRNLVHQGLSPPVLVFVQSRERARELFDELIYDGINVDVIHSDRTLLQRDNVVRSFREGKIWVLICTELMGRGIDFKGVNLVINYDFPPSAISYIHRIGRTGRAGRPGKAITFFTQDDAVNLRSIAQVVKDSGGEVPDYMLQMKKAAKRTRRHLETWPLRRDTISTALPYESPPREKGRTRRGIKRNVARTGSEAPTRKNKKKRKKELATSQ